MVDAKGEYGYTSTSVHEQTKERLEEHKQEDESWTEYYERLLDAYENDGDVSDGEPSDDPSLQDKATQKRLTDLEEYLKDLRVDHTRLKRNLKESDQEGLAEAINEMESTLEDAMQLVHD